MNELMIQESDLELVEALHRFSDGELPMPFERDIFLLGVAAAGADYAPNIEALYGAIQEGDLVKLIREPDNFFDEYAIRLEAESELLPASGEGFSRKLGYIPRANNKVFARLMDAGKQLYGLVRVKEHGDNYYRIVVKIYMKD